MWALSCGERGDGRFGLLVPSAAQSLVLLGLNVVQDFRYQFGVYMIGLVALTLPFARPDVSVTAAASASGGRN